MSFELGNVLPEIIEGARRRITQQLQELQLDDFAIIYGSNGGSILVYNEAADANFVRSRHLKKDELLEVVLEQIILERLFETNSLVNGRGDGYLW